jgi:NADPH:quinone reductase-like Zn-dependent oxidoreductase
MNPPTPTHGLQLLSTLRADGVLHLQLAESPVEAPGPDDVVIRVEAAPINPSDLMTFLPAGDLSQAEFAMAEGRPQVTLRLDPPAATALAGRLGLPVPADLEGAGTVIAAGENAGALMGQRVAALTLRSGMFAQFVTVAAADCAVLPPEVSIREGAGAFCNPQTALAIVETARLEGHAAIIQTAAASNLGQMLARICQEDGVPLVNVVRREEQAALLRSIGAGHVCNSSAPSFRDDLRRAIAETGATVAFDAIGGGAMPGELLWAMEDVARARMPTYSPYGSMEPKQVYIYGHLDPSPTILEHENYGMFWDLRLWALPATLQRIGAARAAALRARAVAGLKGASASRFSHEVSLAGMLAPEAMADYSRLATGAKYLVNPTL